MLIAGLGFLNGHCITVVQSLQIFYRIFVYIVNIVKMQYLFKKCIVSKIFVGLNRLLLKVVTLEADKKNYCTLFLIFVLYYRYVQASAPKPKDVVLVIDRSSSMRKFDRMLATKNAAVTVLNTLTPDDRIAVITFSDKAFALGTQSSELTVSSKNFNPSSFE